MPLGGLLCVRIVVRWRKIASEWILKTIASKCCCYRRRNNASYGIRQIDNNFRFRNKRPVYWDSVASDEKGIVFSQFECRCEVWAKLWLNLKLLMGFEACSRAIVACNKAEKHTFAIQQMNRWTHINETIEKLLTAVLSHDAQSFSSASCEENERETFPSRRRRRRRRLWRSLLISITICQLN